MFSTGQETVIVEINTIVKVYENFEKQNQIDLPFYHLKKGCPTFLSNWPELIFKNFCWPKFSTMATLSNYINNLKNHELFPIQTLM